MLHGDDRSVALAIEEAFELVEQIVVDLSGKRFPLVFEFLLLSFQRFGFCFQVGHLARNAFCQRPRAFIGYFEFALELVGLDHQFEFLILEFPDFIFVPLNFVANRPKLLILPGLILLCPKARDAFGTCAHVEFQFFAINFDQAPFLFQRFNARRRCSQLRFKMSSLQGHRPYLSLDLSDLLLSILKNEQLFQFRMHERSTY